MSYTKRDDVPAAAGSLVVELNTGELVAVRCERKRVEAGLSYYACAEVVDALGEPVPGPAGTRIRTETTRAVPVDLVETIGDSAISRDILLVVLGEAPQSSLHWADIQLTGASIRVSIAAAPHAGAADAGAVL